LGPFYESNTGEETSLLSLFTSRIVRRVREQKEHRKKKHLSLAHSLFKLLLLSLLNRKQNKVKPNQAEQVSKVKSQVKVHERERKIFPITSIL